MNLIYYKKNSGFNFARLLGYRYKLNFYFRQLTCTLIESPSKLQNTIKKFNGQIFGGHYLTIYFKNKNDIIKFIEWAESIILIKELSGFKVNYYDKDLAWLEE
ncbi:MAG: hypothetical protein ACOCP8_07820 [archaeon]